MALLAPPVQAIGSGPLAAVSDHDPIGSARSAASDQSGDARETGRTRLGRAPGTPGEDEAASCEPASNRILVRFAPTAAGRDRAALLRQAHASVHATSHLVPGLVTLDTPAPKRAIAALQASSDVAYAELDCRVRVDALPNDPLFGQQWALRNIGQTGGTSGADIHASAAWDVRTDASSVVVAVIDTGIQWNHPDLSANIWVNTGEVAGNGIDDDHNGYVDDRRGWDWVNNDNDPADDYFHGTHVAGTIGAKGNNGAGISGVAWSVKLMPLKAFDSGGSGSLAAIVAALDYAVAKGARVSNNSYSTDIFSPSLYDAFVAAGAAGMVSVAAAGNDHLNVDETPRYPAGYRLTTLLSVAATTATDDLAGFSNYGIYNAHVAAPGASILSTVPGSGYGTASGTSMATPHVAGVAALLLAAHPTWTPLQVRDRILGTVRAIPGLAQSVWSGGVVNAAAALGNGPNVAPPAYPPFTTDPLSPSAVADPAPDPVAAPAPPAYPNVDVVDSSQRSIDPPSIAIDGQGRPSVAYNEYGAGVRLSTLTSGAWTTQAITNAYAEMAWLDLKYGSDGNARIAIQRSWSDLLEYWDPGIVVATVNGGVTLNRVSAACPDADSCFIDWAPSMALDGTGAVQLVFGRTALDGVPINDRIPAPAGTAPTVPGAGLYFAKQNGSSWEVQQLTTGANDALAAFALAPNGSAHVVYRRAAGSSSGLYHATNTTGSWTTRRLTDHGEDFGVALRVDTSSVAHVAFTRAGQGVYYLTRSAGGTWSAATRIFQGNAFQPDLELDAQNKVYLTFDIADDTNTAAGVRYATNKTGAWVVSTLATGQAHLSSLAIDAAGKAHVAYVRAGPYPFGLFYSTNATGSWVTSLVRADSSGPGPGAIAYAVDAAGYGHLAAADHYGQSDAGLYYGTNRSGSWTYSRVASAWPTAVALAVDDGGHASIAFTEAFTAAGAALPAASARVALATNATGSWLVERVSPSNNFDWNGVAVALDHAQQPHLLYADGAGARHLLEARRSGTGWAISTAFTSTGYLENPSMVIDEAGVIHAAIDVQMSGEPGTSIRYLRGQAGAWTSSAATTANEFNVRPSIDRASDGTIWISAMRNDAGIWVHRLPPGGAWSSMNVSGDPSDSFPSLAVDSNDDVQVLFDRQAPIGLTGCTVPACSTGPGLRIATYDGGSWTTSHVTPVPYDFLGVVATGRNGELSVGFSRQWIGMRSIQLTPGPFSASVMLRPVSDTGVSATDGITNAGTLSFDVTFDRPVTGFTSGDVALSGTATGCAIGAPTGSGRAWIVPITSCSPGTLAVTISAGTVSDGGGAGPASDVASRLVRIDRTAPTITAVNVSLRSGTSLPSASTTAPLQAAVTWAASDSGGAGTVSYDVSRSYDGAAFTSQLSGTTATSSSVGLNPGHSYRYEVRARDRAGNLGGYLLGATVKGTLLQQSSSSITYTGTWTTTSSSSLSGGSARYATAAGASAKYSFTGRGVAVVVTRRSIAGKVKVYLDGVLVQTVDTYAASTGYRYIAFAKTWATSGTHTIKLVVVGTSGRPRVTLDAIEILR